MFIHVYTFFLSIFFVNSNQSDRIIKLKVSNAIEIQQVLDYTSRVTDSSRFLTKRSIDYSEALIPDDCTIDITLSKVNDLSFPLNGYSLYDASYIRGRYSCRNGTYKERISNNKFPQESPKYLVAYKESTEQLIYISGAFLKSRIARYYDLRDLDNVKEFLYLKLFDISVSDLKIKSVNKERIEVIGFSGYHNKNIRIKISLEDPDNLTVTID